MWHGKVPNLSYLKVWGCEALVKRDTPNKLVSRSIKRIFVGYPKETMRYYFYYLLENIIFVARYAEFFETNLIKQEASGSTIDFDEIQSEDAQPFENTSLHQHEVEPDTIDPQTDEHELGDHGEPPNYQAALSVPESKKWLEVMNAEMQSMKDNQVWNLVDLPSNSKGFTQTYGVDYEETFSPVADIKAIRILIAIAAYYDYEIWLMDVKTTFLNDLSNTQGPSTPVEVKQMKGIPYASVVGSIMYVVRCTRPDVANTKDMFLVYGGDFTTELGVTCYTDASWETDRDNLRFQTGFFSDDRRAAC
ncbi:retrotransposon protein, putative, ty1-copia subclass [Tanacetum coccineum]